MPTIKDVAKLAGVSHGTVSNIINGVKTVNSDIVIRVEAAMKELGYQPDAKARSLRSNKTNTVGVVLPNIVDNVYSRIYTGIENVARGEGYNISLFLTDDCPEVECTALQQLQQQRIRALIIVSCNPDNRELFDTLIAAGIRIVFVQRKPQEMYQRTFVGLDMFRILYEVAGAFITDSHAQLCLMTGNSRYSCEADAAAGFRKALTDHGADFRSTDIRCAENTKESAFRVAMWWLQSGCVPSVIFTTCSEHAKGVLAAVEMFQEHVPARTAVVSLENESWVQTAVFSHIRKIPQKIVLLGETAARKALLKSDSKGRDISESIFLPVESESPARFRPSAVPHIPADRPLRLVLLEGAASYALRLMFSRFTRQTGIEVEAEILSYEEMQQFSKDCSFAGCCDLIQTNIAWFETLAAKNAFVQLDRLFGEYIRNFSSEILELYSMYQGRMYAMPYMLDTQLLFYRKDLFEDIRYQRLFYEKNKCELRVPRSWSEYEQVAAFFTRSVNPDSPVAFGTTMGGYPFYSVYGFMPYLWEAGASLFDQNGNISANNPGAAFALQRYINTFSYADPAAVNWGWAEQTTQFIQGNAAMMTLYQAHYMDYLSRENISVAGRIGLSSLPGSRSVRGGWTLAIPVQTENLSAAITFLQWLSSPENALPYNVLGGSIPTVSTLGSSELKKSYPWFSCAHSGLAHTQAILPRNCSLSESQFETVLGKQINCALQKQCSPVQALENTDRLLCETT